MDKEALYYKLEDYLDGKLPEKEREELQNRIAVDEQVAEQLALVRLERELGSLMADDELEAKMQQWAGEAESQRKEEENGLGREEHNGRSGKRWLSGVLIAVAALVTVYWLFSPATPLLPEKPPEKERIEEVPVLENTPLQPDTKPGEEGSESSGQQQPERKSSSRPSSSTQLSPIASEKPTREDRTQQLALAIASSTSPIRNLATRSNSTPATGEDEPPLEKGFRLMTEGKLNEARQPLESIPAEPQGLYLNARQYLAYVYFEQEDYNAAIPIFKELIDIGYVDKDKMKWYLALAYLSDGRLGEGLPLAREVAENERDKEVQQAAQALLEELDR